MNLGRSGPWATPYAHSFCDKFLGALRHTTPSILRQRGSAATIATANKIIISVVGNTIVSKLNADEDNPNWYCSELVWAAYYSEGINLNGSTIPNHLYMPDELASSSKLTYRDVE